MKISEAIDKIGTGRFQVKLLIICGMGWAADAMEILIISFVLPAVAEEWNLSSGQTGLIGTAIFLGMLAGAWFWGVISDYIGRRLGFQLTILIDSVFGLLSAFAPGFWSLAVLRALTGFGVGGTLPVDYSIFAEYLPREKRGRYLVILESFWALGTILAAGLAWFIIPRWGWRPLLAAAAVPALIIYFIRRHIPESPRYLLARGKKDEARRVLEHVARQNGKELEFDDLEAEETVQKNTVKTLWRPKYRRRTTMLWITWFAISIGYYGMFIWLPSILVDRGFSFLETYRYVFLMALAQLPGYFSAAWLIERWGRKPTLTVYLLGSGVFTFLFAVFSSLAGILTAAVLMSFFALGAWGALYAYTPELYPTQVRSTGMGAASGMTRIGGSLAPTLGGLLISISLLSALSLYAAAFVVGGITVALLGRETKGRSLEDIA